MNLRNESLYIWINKNGTVEWKARNLKPSELCLFAAILQEHALKMMDGPETKVVLVKGRVDCA